MKIAYLMSRFPRLTETFVLNEMLEAERQGIQVEIYPLLRARNTGVDIDGHSLSAKFIERIIPTRGQPLMHPEAEPFVMRAHYAPLLSWPILRANLRFLLSKPRKYLTTWFGVLRGARGSANLFLGTLILFPKFVYWAAQMRAGGIQHLHAHFANHPTTAALVIHRLTGLPYSFTAHATDLYVDQHLLREKVSAASFVVAISQYGKEFIVNYCGETFRERIKMIHVGVDPNVFYPERRAPTSCFAILCIGRLLEVKGQRYLIEACRLLRARGIQFQCKLAGDGADHMVLEQQIKEAGLEDAVQLLGARTHQHIVHLLKSTDTLVQPSVPTKQGRKEGIPVVLMEASSCGLPIIGTELGGIREIIENKLTGILVPPFDSVALANALELLACAPELRATLGAAGREKVIREFNLEKNVTALIQEFEQSVA